jgi:hypothetical protein
MRARPITIKALRRPVLLVGAVSALMLGTAAPAPTSTRPNDGSLSTGNGVTTPTPPAPPLTLDVHHDGYPDYLTKKFAFGATTSNDSTLVATGSIRKTTTQLAAGEPTEITARIKHAKRLNEKPKPGKPKIKIKLAATDEFGQTATDQIKVTVLRNRHFPKCPDPNPEKLLCTGYL